MRVCDCGPLLCYIYLPLIIGARLSEPHIDEVNVCEKLYSDAFVSFHYLRCMVYLSDFSSVANCAGIVSTGYETSPEEEASLAITLE